MKQDDDDRPANQGKEVKEKYVAKENSSERNAIRKKNKHHIRCWPLPFNCKL